MENIVPFLVRAMTESDVAAVRQFFGSMDRKAPPGDAPVSL